MIESGNPRLETEPETAAKTDRDRAAHSLNSVSPFLRCNRLYLLAIAVSVSFWFVAIRAPLWLDEAISFWQSNEGIARVVGSPNLLFGSYPLILWWARKVFGTSEIGLRIPSVLAMLAAVYLLYLAARELFDTDTALIATIVFCLHPIVTFTSIDARPYAFATLATNAAILVLVRLRRSDSTWLAAALGLFASLIIYFHFMYAVILPVLAICFVLFKTGDRKTFWRQAGVALASFVVTALPLVPGLLYIFRTRGTHVFEKAPALIELLWTVAPGWLALIAGLAILFAVAGRHPFVRGRVERWRVLFCLALAFVPLLVLYGVSVATPLHIFVYRYRLVAIQGIALCWALLISRIDSRALRVLFCLALVGVTAYSAFASPDSRTHGYTWKYALEAAEKNAAPDNAPVLICSDLIESDYIPMPLDSAKDSVYFAPLSYYKLSVPVVPLPRSLNDEAVRVASSFLQDAAPRHKRFLAMAFTPSYPTVRWLEETTSGTYDSRTLGIFDGVEVVEFTPRIGSR